jgi:hypothetical protein
VWTVCLGWEQVIHTKSLRERFTAFGKIKALLLQDSED